MALLRILTWPDPRLKEKAEPIEEITPEIVQLAHDMAETMYAAPGVGLAANQVGVNKRLMVVDCHRPRREDEPEPDPRAVGPGLLYLINPEIVEYGGTICDEEGCLSFPGETAEVNRWQWVKVRALDLEGKPFEVIGVDLLARCLQHEIDHLDGVVFTEKLSALKRSLINKRAAKATKERELEDMD
ncbi:MAG: peptide deformylase [Candidatus Methylomirabilis sp.]|nr:peptide deformylase [Deltaproteobacteria bacterium]